MICCALCDYTNETSIVQHLRETHGLQKHLDSFPDLPIVNKNLFTALLNLELFQFRDSTPGLDSIRDDEREAIIVAAKSTSPLRSEIIQTNDF